MARVTEPAAGAHAFTPLTATPAAPQRRGHVLNAALLLACVSMYFGTGWSLVLFSFPVAPQLTPQNYYMQFVPQVQTATRFFTYMTGVMLLSGAIMTWAEWRTRYRWVPIVTLLGIVAATALTMAFIIPYNREMAGHITDQARLTDVLDRWMLLNRIRVALWTVQWLAMTWYFVHKATLAPIGRRA